MDLTRLPELLPELVQSATTKMVLVVLDGLGGLPHPEFGNRTELEAAPTPNLDALAARSSLGLAHPVLPGITPGSSAGHLALFGYDPLRYRIGRGVLEALGIGFELEQGDVAVRANFATAKPGPEGPVIVDRRAGRLPTSSSEKICTRLQAALPEIEDVKIFVSPVKEHRFLVVFRGEGLEEEVADTDPQREGYSPLSPHAKTEGSQKTARVAAKFLEKAKEVLREEPQANFILLRGFSARPSLPSFPSQYALRAGALAAYPMYRGLASLVGMELIPTVGETTASLLTALEEHWKNYDYFFLHLKATDSRGEDGDFQGKIKVIAEFDAYLPLLLALQPDVLVITGDHATPARFKAHAWHPVPFLLFSPWVLPERKEGFNEYTCATGKLGHFPLLATTSLILAHAQRLTKFSA